MPPSSGGCERGTPRCAPEKLPRGSCEGSGEERWRALTFVPNFSRPFGRIEMFTSHRIDPSAMFPSLTPRKRTSRRISAPYAAASRPVRRSGSETISMSGVPARL